MKRHRTTSTFHLDDRNENIPIDAFPSVSVIIPTHNCSQSISLTIDNLLNQNYPNIEVIAIDLGSTDHTLEILQGYQQAVKVLSAAVPRAYEAINFGIEECQGVYVNILFPGDFYFHTHTLTDMMTLACREQCPDLVYCGTLIRDGRHEVKFLFRELNREVLKRGQQPTSIQGCWFKRKILMDKGLFNTDYSLRGGYDFLCRFCQNDDVCSVGIKRAFVDYDLRWVTSHSVVIHFIETGKILLKHFGLQTYLYWLITQKDFSRFIRLWWRKLHVAFFGK